MESAKEVSIIILSYNTKELLRECLQSVFGKIKHADFEVIVVDNASDDCSVAMIKKEFAQVHLIESKRNLGFGNGINLGANQARGKYLLFLNSDTQIVKDDVTGMLGYFDQHKQTGILGGKIEKPNGEVQQSAKQFYTLAQVIALLFGRERFIAPENSTKIHDVDWVEGSFLMIKKNIF